MTNTPTTAGHVVAKITTITVRYKQQQQQHGGNMQNQCNKQKQNKISDNNNDKCE